MTKHYDEIIVMYFVFLEVCVVTMVCETHKETFASSRSALNLRCLKDKIALWYK